MFGQCNVVVDNRLNSIKTIKSLKPTVCDVHREAKSRRSRIRCDRTIRLLPIVKLARLRATSRTAIPRAASQDRSTGAGRQAGPGNSHWQRRSLGEWSDGGAVERPPAHLPFRSPDPDFHAPTSPGFMYGNEARNGASYSSRKKSVGWKTLSFLLSLVYWKKNLFSQRTE